MERWKFAESKKERRHQTAHNRGSSIRNCFRQCHQNWDSGSNNQTKLQTNTTCFSCTSLEISKYIFSAIKGKLVSVVMLTALIVKELTSSGSARPHAPGAGSHCRLCQLLSDLLEKPYFRSEGKTEPGQHNRLIHIKPPKLFTIASSKYSTVLEILYIYYRYYKMNVCYHACSNVLNNNSSIDCN